MAKNKNSTNSLSLAQISLQISLGIILILLSLIALWSVWNYFDLLGDAQEIQNILDEQCPNLHITVEIDHFDDDPYRTWDTMHAQCNKSYPDDSFVCHCGRVN